MEEKSLFTRSLAFSDSPNERQALQPIFCEVTEYAILIFQLKLAQFKKGTKTFSTPYELKMPLSSQPIHRQWQSASPRRGWSRVFTDTPVHEEINAEVKIQAVAKTNKLGCNKSVTSENSVNVCVTGEIRSER